ncbi:MAG: DUF3332 domain-containing protein [Myxococcales bacterium]|jgi:hypothetical protein
MKTIKPSRRQFIVAAAAVGASGCFGSFGATNALYDWNEGVSNNKWIQWLVFLVLIILPVYGLFILADAIVLNTIEFWTGTNPVGTAKLPEGHTLHSSRTDDPDVIRHEVRKDGELVRVIHVKRVSEDEMMMLDEHMKPLARARMNADGEIELLDPEGRSLSALDAGARTRVALAVDAGMAPTEAVLDSVSAPQRERMLALTRQDAGARG